MLKFEQCYCYIINQSRFGSVDNEFMQIAEKIVPQKVAQNDVLGNIPEVILPKNIHKKGEFVDISEPILPKK